MENLSDLAGSIAKGEDLFTGHPIARAHSPATDWLLSIPTCARHSLENLTTESCRVILN